MEFQSTESTCSKNSAMSAFWLHINSLATVFARSEAAATEYFMLVKEAFIWLNGTPANSNLCLVASTVLSPAQTRTLP